MPDYIERRRKWRKNYLERILNSDRLRAFDLTVKEKTRKNARILLKDIWTRAFDDILDCEKLQKVEISLREDLFFPRNEVRKALESYIKSDKVFESLVSKLIGAGILERRRVKIPANRKRKREKKQKRTFYRIISPESKVGRSPRPSWSTTINFEDLLSRCRTVLVKESLQRLGLDNPDRAILKEMDRWNRQRGLPAWKSSIRLSEPEERDESILQFRVEEERFAFMWLWVLAVQEGDYSHPKWPIFSNYYGSRFNVFEYSGPKYPKTWNDALDHIEKRMREILGVED